ncbi:MAG: N-acyl homoserine lactonase family protein [Galbitalea sp.]
MGDDDVVQPPGQIGWAWPMTSTAERMRMPDYSIWIVEYGYIDQFPASNMFTAQPNEGHRRMPYCFGVLRSAERNILVDTGFADESWYPRLTKKYGPTSWQAPIDVLRKCGVTAEEIDTVILTHSHFDHAGCVDAFPNARVVIQRREIDIYRESLARGPRYEYLTRSCQPDLADYLESRPEGMVLWATGTTPVLDGITVVPASDTHTAGSQVVVVENGVDGRWLMAGDIVYQYENLEGLHDDGVLAPIGMTTGSAARWIDFVDEMLDLTGGDIQRILPFHELKVWERFPSRLYDDGLHVAEISLAGGHESVLAKVP